MGDSICKAAVPFKIEGVADGDFGRLDELDCEPVQEMLQKIEDALEEDDESKKSLETRGWAYTPEVVDYGKGRSQVYVTKLTKGQHVVFGINENQYSSGGGLTQSFFADDRESLVEFCKDWGFDASQIEGNAAVVMVA